MSALLIKPVDGGYAVHLDGACIGEVFRERQRSDRYPYGEPQISGRGRWRWVASTITDEDFATRQEAVADLVRRYRVGRDWGDDVSAPEPLMRLAFGATATDDPDDLAEVRKALHDQVIADLGPSRRSGVSWTQCEAQDGLRVLDDHGLADDKGMREFLRANPEGVLVIAFVEADPAAAGTGGTT